MWIRLRLDVGWRDLGFGVFASLAPGNRQTIQKRLETFWSQGRGDALACLSVRSGFDLLLEALDLPAGSEVLFSAITLRDMPRLAEAHGLVPVPVDVCGSDDHVDLKSLRQSLTSRSKVVVVAHLFGARPDLEGVLKIAREHNLLVVEDCAQAWCGLDWRGGDATDAALFSFGAIKTATALGGALCRVKDPAILARMRQLQAQWPVQTAGRLPFKLLKFALLKAISTKGAFGAMAALGSRFGKSVDDLLAGLTRGFSDEDFFDQLRQQPPAGLLRMLEHRLESYDSQRIARRLENARRIIANLELETAQPELLDPRHTFWLFPYLTEHADELVTYLRRHGFDTTQRGRMKVVPPPPDRPQHVCPQATQRLNRTVFLPCYPGMPKREIDRLCESILRFKPEVAKPANEASL